MARRMRRLPLDSDAAALHALFVHSITVCFIHDSHTAHPMACADEIHAANVSCGSAKFAKHITTGRYPPRRCGERENRSKWLGPMTATTTMTVNNQKLEIHAEVAENRGKLQTPSTNIPLVACGNNNEIFSQQFCSARQQTVFVPVTRTRNNEPDTVIYFVMLWKIAATSEWCSNVHCTVVVIQFGGVCKTMGKYNMR